MGYIDLMLVRTPGKKLVKFAGGADKQLQKVANNLGRLDDLGRAIPADTMFGSHHARAGVAQRFANTEYAFAQGRDEAWRFARTENPGSYSYESPITKADEAGRSTADLNSRYPQLTERMHDSINRAGRRADSAEELLRRNNFGESGDARRKFAAENASSDLRDGANAIGDARFGLERILGPFREHDNVRFHVEELATDARERAAVASEAKVGGNTNAHKAARALSATTQELESAVNSLVPGAPVTQIDELAKRGSTEAKAAVEAGRTIKTPKHFAAKVAAAYTGTIGLAAGLPAAGYVVYRTKLSD